MNAGNVTLQLRVSRGDAGFGGNGQGVVGLFDDVRNQRLHAGINQRLVIGLGVNVLLGGFLDPQGHILIGNVGPSDAVLDPVAFVVAQFGAGITGIGGFANGLEYGSRTDGCCGNCIWL